MTIDAVMEAALALPPLAAVLLRAALAGTAILGLAFFGTVFFKRRPAQAHAILFAGILSFPLAAALSMLPAVPLPILPPASRIGIEIEISREYSIDSDIVRRVRIYEDERLRSDCIFILEMVWAAGVAAGIGRLARQRAALRRLFGSAAAVTDALLIEEAGRAVAALWLSRAPYLYASEKLDIPIVSGIWKPSVVFPKNFGARVRGAAIRGVLRHEIAHIARLDNLTDAIARLIAVIFWFAPLIRFAMKRMREQRERACDEAAVAGEPDPLVYARALIDFARSRANPFPAPGIVDGRDGFRELRKRVADIIQMHHARKEPMKHKRLSSAILIAALLLLSLMLASARPVPSDMWKAGGVSASMGGASSASTALPAFRWPLRMVNAEGKQGDFRISLPFGNADNPITKKPYHHAGIDITFAIKKAIAGRRADVVAAADGRVMDAGYDEGRGNFIRIGHAGNADTLYCKLAGPAVARIGDAVVAGQTLGVMGSTGVSTGPHLHFELRIDGEPANPLDYLSKP